MDDDCRQRRVQVHRRTEPGAIQRWFVEGNMSGDKKATMGPLAGVRGTQGLRRDRLPGELVERRLHTTVDALVDYWRLSAVAGVMSGSIGVHGHYANGLAAMFIACGQDAACVAEAAVGITRFDRVRRRALCRGDAAESDRRHGGRRDTAAFAACVPGHHGPVGHRTRASLRGSRGGDGARRRVVDHRRVGGREFTSAHQRLARGAVEGVRAMNRWIVYQRNGFH